MSSLAIRRLLVWVVSMTLGLLVGYGVITVGFDLLPLLKIVGGAIETPQGISLAEYGIMYFLFTAVPIGLVFVIWLDAFMDTRILPD